MNARPTNNKTKTKVKEPPWPRRPGFHQAATRPASPRHAVQLPGCNQRTTPETPERQGPEVLAPAAPNKPTRFYAGRFGSVVSACCPNEGHYRRRSGTRLSAPAELLAYQQDWPYQQEIARRMFLPKPAPAPLGLWRKPRSQLAWPSDSATAGSALLRSPFCSAGGGPFA
jgi:hypothetical protein